MRDAKRLAVSLALTSLLAFSVTNARTNDLCGDASDTFVVIDPPGATFVSATGINPQGDIVGRYIAGGVTHAFLLREDNFQTIDVPGASFTAGRSINPQGHIVGNYTSSGVGHGFLLRDGVFQSIDVPGATATTAFGLNARGDIAGIVSSGGEVA